MQKDTLALVAILFKKMELLKDHMKNLCNMGKTLHIFPGGVYYVKKTIFEQLEDFDIIVDDRYCPYLAVCDFEALLIKSEVKQSEKLMYTAEHRHLSCAVHTNVPGFEPVCFVEENSLVPRSTTCFITGQI